MPRVSIDHRTWSWPCCRRSPRGTGHAPTLAPRMLVQGTAYAGSPKVNQGYVAT
jgi:hypothetical protein